MSVLFLMAVILLGIAFLVFVLSDGEFVGISITIWAIATIMLIIIVVNLSPKRIGEEPAPVANVPEEYWNGDIKNLEVYKRTKDTVFLRFKDSAYNKALNVGK